MPYARNRMGDRWERRREAEAYFTNINNGGGKMHDKPFSITEVAPGSGHKRMKICAAVV